MSRSGSTRPASTTRCWSRRTAPSIRCAGGISSSMSTSPTSPPDMTDRFEIEIDTTAANEKWHVEVEENLKRQAEEKETAEQNDMSPRNEAPDVDRLARSMLMLYGAHDDDARARQQRRPGSGTRLGRRHRLSIPDRAAAAARGHAAGPRAVPDVGTGVRRLPVLSCGRRREEARALHTRRCSGTPRRRSAARSSPRSGSPAASRPAPGRARSWPTASNTLSPKAVWRKCRRRPPPATASQFLQREQTQKHRRNRQQSIWALLRLLATVLKLSSHG